MIRSILVIYSGRPGVCLNSTGFPNQPIRYQHWRWLRSKIINSNRILLSFGLTRCWVEWLVPSAPAPKCELRGCLRFNSFKIGHWYSITTVAWICMSMHIYSPLRISLGVGHFQPPWCASRTINSVHSSSHSFAKMGDFSIADACMLPACCQTRLCIRRSDTPSETLARCVILAQPNF